MVLNALRQSFTVLLALALTGIGIHVIFSKMNFHRGFSIFDAVGDRLSNLSEHVSRSRDNHVIRPSSHVNRSHVVRPSSHVTQPSPIIVVSSTDNFTNRIQSFNDLLVELRRKTLEQRDVNETVWNFFDEHLTLSSSSSASSLQVVSDETDDHIKNHIELLALNYSHLLTTVVLPWLPLPPSSSSPEFVWNYAADTFNVGLQLYYQWTGDDKLCRWFETSVTDRHTFDVFLSNKCERNITHAADRSGTLPPEVKVDHQQTSRGTHSPSINTHMPPYVFYTHLIQNAIVTKTGEVISGNLKLALSACYSDSTTSAPPSDQVRQTPVYRELYVISQFWGSSVFHRMTEIIPRLAFAVDFLIRNPEIRIHAPESSVDGRLAQLVRIFGIDPQRLVSGLARARVVYLPRSTRCGKANIAESQLAAQKYADYVTREWPHVASVPPHRLIIVKRHGNRRFTEQVAIERALKRTAADFNLTYTLFDDRSLPTLNVTMQLFYSAVMVVGPHGAGLSNIYFSRPGTYIVEGICNPPHTNMCFQRLAQVLGHRWHGVTSRGGCLSAVSFTPAEIDNAVRTLLATWRRHSTSAQ